MTNIYKLTTIFIKYKKNVEKNVFLMLLISILKLIMFEKKLTNEERGFIMQNNVVETFETFEEVEDIVTSSVFGIIFCCA